jgi:spermidine/putrescine transport system permease protein
MSVSMTKETKLARGALRSRLAARLGEGALSLNALLMYVFLYTPILVLVVLSFNASRFVTNWTGFTFDWYVKLFQNEVIGLALRNSLIVAVSSTLISTVFGTMVALVMERYDFVGKLPFDALLYLPIIIPDISMAVMLLLFFVLVHIPLSLATIIISHVAFNISFVAVVVRARLADFDRSLEEAAMDLGANEWQTFWRVTLPLLMPGILGGALLAFTLSIDDFVITFFTAGIGSTTLPLRVYSMVKLGVTPEINALSTMMLLGSMSLVMLSLIMQRKGGGRGIEIG